MSRIIVNIVLSILFMYSEGIFAQKYHAAAAFGLKGHVKEWYVDGELKHSFDKDGRLLNSNGETVGEYDDEGMLKKDESSGLSSAGFVYRNNRLESKNCKTIFGNYIVSYVYDKTGNLLKETETSYIGDELILGKGKTITTEIVFENIKLDSEGNYTYRDVYEIEDNKKVFKKSESSKVVYWETSSSQASLNPSASATAELGFVGILPDGEILCRLDNLIIKGAKGKEVLILVEFEDVNTEDGVFAITEIATPSYDDSTYKSFILKGNVQNYNSFPPSGGRFKVYVEIVTGYGSKIESGKKIIGIGKTNNKYVTIYKRPSGTWDYD